MVEINELLKLALNEDTGSGDITSQATVGENQLGKAKILSKQKGVLCGLELVERIFSLIKGNVKIHFIKSDGDLLKEGDQVLSLSGSLRAILQGERLSLNLLGHLSGIATKTNEIIQQMNDTNLHILDTRKTMPLWRKWQKYAVKTGGGYNHRFGLYDMVLIKENHIEAAGGLENALRKSIEYRENQKAAWKIEVEVKNIDELKRAIQYPIDVVMLDNMHPEQIRKAVEINSGKVKLEVSGGIDEHNINPYLNLGIDFVSLGALTHSVTNFDFSLLIQPLDNL